MDYLIRYQNGEQVAVWEELIALNEAIREEPLYVQAEAVAHETMRRVKHNVELIVERLHMLNYNFIEEPLTALPPENVKQISHLEQMIGIIPLSFRIFCEEVGQINLMGSHPKLSEYAPDVASPRETTQFFLKALGASSEELAQDNVSMLNNLFQSLQEVTKSAAENTPNPKVDQFKALMDQLYKPLREPQSTPSKQFKIDVYSDPLVVRNPFLNYDDDPELYIHQEWDDEQEDEPWQPAGHSFNIAPDEIFKSNHGGSGSLEILFPDAAIDAKVIQEFGAETGRVESGYFVEYLREYFEWGGFPGFKHSKQPPMAEIEFLKKDLLPI